MNQRTFVTRCRTLLLVAACLGGCELDRSKSQSETATAGAEQVILSMHAQILQAHRDRDAEAWMALEADTLTVASRGEIFVSPRPERLAQRQHYFEATRFSVYRDLQAPIVRIADDGSLAWLFAQVEIVAHSTSAADSSHSTWAWIELYERHGQRWRMVGNVSNERL